MPRKKKRNAVTRPQRKTTYTRALETAEKRLERANIELTKYAEKLKGLSVEIPHLESVIAVLSGRRQDQRKDAPYAVQGQHIVSSNPMSAVIKGTDLSEYVAPSLDGVGSHPAVHDPEDDKFLPDV